MSTTYLIVFATDRIEIRKSRMGGYKLYIDGHYHCMCLKLAEAKARARMAGAL